MRVALIMAGGGGSRLWPASTEDRPKQLFDPTLGGQSLLRRTVDRLRGFVDLEATYVVTTRAQAPEVAAAVPELSAEQLILEPFGRNTAPCIALSVQRLQQTHAGATVVVLPADHLVRDEAGFRQSLATAAAHAEAGACIVALGIEPDHPATGYGYIERAQERLPAVDGDAGAPVHAAARFVEKPDDARARQFLGTGRYLWNAGIFVMPLRRIAAELETHCHATWQALRADSVDDAYAAITPEPIDTAVMEKQADLRVVPARVGWTDLGSWRAVFEIASADAAGNAAVRGAAPPPVLVDCERVLAWAEDVQIAVVGGRELAVVQSGNRVLVCPLSRAQDVRDVVEQLRQRSRSQSS